MSYNTHQHSALITAILKEVENKLGSQSSGGARYSHAMVRHALSVLQRALDSEKGGKHSLDQPLTQSFGDEEKGADWVAGQIRRRTITKQSSPDIEAVLANYVYCKLAVYNPNFLASKKNK